MSTLGDALKLLAEVAIDEQIAEIQLRAANPGDTVTITLPNAGQIKWSDGSHQYKVTAFEVVKVK